LKDVEAAKLAKIEAAKATDPKASSGGDSFAMKLATKIIDNIQMDITNIHIRYEDDLTDPAVCISCQFFADSFQESLRIWNHFG
jgi:vacuolar protein sorting-associated protein 13A/C